MKRRDREARERNAEAELLNSMYQVGTARNMASDGGGALVHASDLAAMPWLCMQAERTRELAQIKAEEEDRLAAVMARRQQEKERAEREVQHLREQSEELRG